MAGGISVPVQSIRQPTANQAPRQNTYQGRQYSGGGIQGQFSGGPELIADTSTGAGLQSMGAGLGALGEAWEKETRRRQNLEALEEVNAFRDRERKALDAMRGMEGKLGYDAAVRFMNDFYDQEGPALVGKSRGRYQELYYTEVLDRSRDQGLNMAADWRRRQGEVWEKSVFDGQMAGMMARLDGDPDALAEVEAEGLTLIWAMNPDRDTAAKELAMQGQVRETAVNSAMAQGDYGKAQSILREAEKIPGVLSPEQALRLQGSIKAGVAARRQEAEYAQKRAFGRAVDTAYSGMLESALVFPSLEERKIAMDALIAQTADENMRKELYARAENDFRRLRQVRDAGDMSALLQAREAVKGMLPSRIRAWMEQNWAGSDAGRERAEIELTAPPKRETPENKRAFNALMAAIDLGKITDAETLEATAWQLGMTGGQTEAADKWLREGGQRGKIYSLTESAWRDLNPGKPVSQMPVDLPEWVLQLVEPGRPPRRDEVRKAISRMAIQGEGLFADTLGAAIAEGPQAVEKWRIDDDAITDEQRTRAEDMIRQRGQAAGLSEEQIAALFTDENIAGVVKEEILGIRPRGAR